VLLERGKAEAGETVEEDIRVLERAFQYSQKARQDRLTSEISLAWYILSPEKGLRVCSQIESKALLIQTYCGMIRTHGPARREESKRLLEKALQEAGVIDGAAERLRALKMIAESGMAVDQAQARAAYLSAYRIVEASVF
jgi:hypothetical protein